LLAYAEVEQVLLDLVGDDLPETYRLLGPQDSQRRRLAILRGKAIEHLVNAAAEAFIEQQPTLLAGDLEGDLVEHMHGAARRCVLDAKQMARKRIFQDKRKTLHEIGAYSTLETLLDAFCGAVNELHAGQNLSFKHQRILDLLGHTIPQADWPPYRSYLRVVDFIAGMTDLYAADMAAQIRGISRN
jgi:dGTPase